MNTQARPHRVYTVMRNLSIAFAVLVAGLILLYFLPTAWGRYCMAHIPTPAHLFFSIGVVCAMAMLVAVALGIVRPVRWEEPVDVMRWCLAGIGALLGTGMFAASVWLMYFSTFSCRTVTPRTFADRESMKADWLCRRFFVDHWVPAGACDISVSGNTGLGWLGMRCRYSCKVSEAEFRAYVANLRTMPPKPSICTNAFDRVCLGETSQLRPDGGKVLFGDGSCPTNFLSYTHCMEPEGGDMFLAYDLDTSTMHAYFSCH